jgi:hypothetical protein
VYTNSEGRREELQVHIVKTSETLREDNTIHLNQKTEVITENAKLRFEIQILKQHMGSKELDHL